MPRLFHHLVLIFSLTFVITGCGSRDDLRELKDTLVKIEERPKGRIPPPPEFKSFPTFTYQAAGLRSPFEAPVEIIFETKLQTGKNVQPDLQRRREALERYSLDAMSFVGTLLNEEDEGAVLWAIVDDGQGGVHRIREGNYIGQNHGRIMSINERRIEILEIVPSGQSDDDGNKAWIERPRNLVLRDA